MGFRSSTCFLALTAFILGSCAFGCMSFRVLRTVEGRDIVCPEGTFQAGKTTMTDVLSLLGAPDKLTELEGKNMLVYEKMVNHQNTLSIGVPIYDIRGPSLDLSAYGTLVRYDTLALFFTPDGILQDMVFEKGSSRPYLQTLFTEQ